MKLFMGVEKVIQVIEAIEEQFLSTVSDGKTQSDYVVYALIGKDTKEFYGLIINPVAISGKKRQFMFYEIDRMKRILETMGGWVDMPC